MSSIRQGRIYKNLRAGYPTYVVTLYPRPSRSYLEPPAVSVLTLTYYKGKWELRRGEYFRDCFIDSENYPIVGYIDLKKVLREGIMGELGIGDDSDGTQL